MLQGIPSARKKTAARCVHERRPHPQLILELGSANIPNAERRIRVAEYRLRIAARCLFVARDTRAGYLRAANQCGQLRLDLVEKPVDILLAVAALDERAASEHDMMHVNRRNHLCGIFRRRFGIDMRFCVEMCAERRFDTRQEFVHFLLAVSPLTDWGFSERHAGQIINS